MEAPVFRPGRSQGAGVAMTDDYDALVIGAGPAGLATSRELARRGVSHLVVERGGTVGQTWADLYDSLVLHTTRRLSALPDLAFPPGTPRFPTRLDLLGYLREYARRFSLPVQVDTPVVGLQRTSRHWTVRTSRGDTLAARAVVVASGIVSNPYEPPLPGRERFAGCVVHSAAYRRTAPFAGQRVLVVGAGNSAADIAVDLARDGIDVTLAVRSGALVLPLRVAGIPIQYLGFALAALPRRAQHAFGTAMRAASTLVGRRPILPPPPIRDCARVPVIGHHLAEALQCGRVRMKRGAVDLVPGAVRCADGDVLPIDTVILATGYRAAVGFLSGVARLDGCGFAMRTDAVTSADHPGLYFVGHNPDIRGGLYRIGRDARLAAARIRSSLDGTQRTPTERRPPPYER